MVVGPKLLGGTQVTIEPVISTNHLTGIKADPIGAFNPTIDGITMYQDRVRVEY
jgi:hypothetical protein